MHKNLEVGNGKQLIIVTAESTVQASSGFIFLWKGKGGGAGETQLLHLSVKCKIKFRAYRNMLALSPKWHGELRTWGKHSLSERASESAPSMAARD